MKNLIYILVFLLAALSSNAVNNEKEKPQQKIITGKVIDNNGETLAGAKITIEETGETFYADFEGNYKLTVKTDKEYSVLVNTIGYKPLVLKTTSLTTFSDFFLTAL